MFILNKCLHYSCKDDEKISSVHKLLTTLQATDSQSLSRVHREAVVAVLDVGLTGHGVEVGLQGELHVVPAGLYLRGRTEMSTVILKLIFDCCFTLNC